MSSLRPVAVVLTAPGPVAGTLDVPAALATLAGRIEFRACDGTGLAGALPGARALFMWDFFSSALADAWSAATDLEWIHLAAAGVDTLLFDALRDSDVVVTNARGTFDRPIAEFVLASVLAHAKRLYESWELQRNGVWRHRETATVAGARALAVGTGAIAREIARLLAAVGVVVRGAGRTPSVTDPDFTEVVSSLDLRAGVGWADYVINATPLTAQTTGLFDAAVFSAMRPGAMFVNVGRGQSVVEADLLAVLESGHLSGAALLYRTVAGRLAALARARHGGLGSSQW